jgi:hypothetical protein
VLDSALVWPIFRRGSASNIPEEFLIRGPTERMHVIQVLVQRQWLLSCEVWCKGIGHLPRLA